MHQLFLLEWGETLASTVLAYDMSFSLGVALKLENLILLQPVQDIGTSNG